MSNIAFLFLPLAFFYLPAVLPFVSHSSQVVPPPKTGGELHLSMMIGIVTFGVAFGIPNSSLGAAPTAVSVHPRPHPRPHPCSPCARALRAMLQTGRYKTKIPTPPTGSVWIFQGPDHVRRGNRGGGCEGQSDSSGDAGRGCPS